MTDTPRPLLLVEFTTVDRFHCAISFPYLNGAARRAGLQTRWLRFAIKAAATMGQQIGVPLSAGDLQSLAAVADDLAPGWVLFGHRPGDDVTRAVAGDGRRLGYLGGFDEGEDGPCQRLDEGELLGWLGLPPLPGRLPEVAGADFDWEPGNALAEQARPLPFLACGPECLYCGPVDQNPVYEGVDLAGCVNLDGCAFCRSDRGDRAWDTPPLELARRHLEAALRTHPPWRHRPRYRLTGEQIFARVDRLADLVLELELEPCDLLLDARADRVVRAAGRLERAVATLDGTGHVIHVCLVGLESFSPPELRRMNKGITVTRLIKAVDLLLGLEASGADSFSVQEYGGFSTILYTPWTTLDDLWLNLEVVELFGLARLCGKLLTSRLRLYPELPLARLARRDGLLLDGPYADPALDTARRNFYPGELPWRFADPAVELVNRVTTRLDPRDDALAGDALHARVQAWLAALPSPGALTAARSLVAALRSSDDHGVSTVDELMEAAADVAGGRRRPIHTVTGAESMASDGLLREEKWTPASAMMRLGRKPVRKEEPLTRQQVEALERDGADLPNLCFRQRRRTRDDDAVFEMFYGEDAALVQETCRLSDQLEDPDAYLDEKDRLVARIGVLLGYPACCAEAFALESLAGWERNEWIHLARRLAHEGPLPPEMNPFQHLFFVPCAADCGEARTLVHQIMEDRGQQVDAEPERWDEEARLPVLFLLNRPGQFVPLHPLEPPTDERIRYRAERRSGDDPRLEAVLRGDTLELDEGRLAVLRRGDVIQTFALEATVWWHERAFQPDFWRPVVARLLASGQAAEVRTPEEVVPPPETPRFHGELEDWAGPEQLIHTVAMAWDLAGAHGPPPEVVRQDRVRGDDSVARLLLALDGDQYQSVSLEGRRLDGRVHYELTCEPPGSAPARPFVRLVRGLADLLDCRTRPRAVSDLEAGRPRGVSRLRHRAERAALQLSASRRLARVSTPWPTADGHKVLLTLREKKRRVDLYLEPARADGRHYLAAGHISVSHYPHTDLDARAEGLIRILGKVLERQG